MGSLSGASNGTVELDFTGHLTINQSSDQNYDGAITGTGGITMAGTNTLTLDGTNTYSGGTTLNSGTLIAGSNAALGSGALTLNGGRLSVGSGVTLSNPVNFGASGGTLGGNGTFGGAVSIGANATLAPGNSVGLLNFNSGLTWAPNGTYNIEVQSAGGSRGSGYDSVNVTGGLAFTATLGTPFTFNLISLNAGGTSGNVADFDSSMGYSWMVAHTDGLTGFNPADISISTSLFTNSLGVGAFNVSTVGNDIFVNFTPVPEPSTYALLGVGAGFVLFTLLKRRRKSCVTQAS
jgi:autotransporter-associated beta strand protein